MSRLCKFYLRTARMFLLAGLAAISVLPTRAQTAMSSSAGAPVPASNPMKLVSTKMVTMIVANVDREAEWYMTVLGFHELPEPGSATPDPNAAFKVRKVELGDFRLHLVQHKGSTRPAVKVPYSGELEGYDHISFTTPAINESYKWLKAHGITDIDITRDKKTNELQTLKFHDPEGNEIHVELPN